MERLILARLLPAASSLAVASAFATVVIWSSAFVGIRFVLREIPPGPFILLRFGAASVFFFVLFALGRVRRPEFRDVPGLLALGLVGQVFYQISLAYAQTRVSAGAAAVAIALAPVLSALFAAPLLGERLSAVQWVGMAVAFAGVLSASFGAGDHFGFEPMALLGLLAAAFAAAYFVLQKPFLKRYGPLDLTAYCVWVCTAATLPFAPELPRLVAEARTSTLLAVAYLGLLPTAVGYTLWGYALARRPAGEVASFLYLQPPATFLLAWSLLGETPTLAAVLGGAMAVAGVALVNRKPGG